MQSREGIDRRGFLALCGSVSLLAPLGWSASPEYGLMERFTLDLGHQGSRAGPLAALADGSLVWVTTEPEAPYLAQAMWPISRLALRRSDDGGRSWGKPHVFLRGSRDYSLLSHALRLSTSGVLIHIFCRYSGYDYDTASPAKSLAEVFTHRSADGGRTWGAPRKISTGERYNADILSIEQLSNGRLVYPFAFLTATKGQFAVSAMYSDDDGLTWTRAENSMQAGGAGFESGASEPSVVALPDGRLWMLIRAQTGFQWESFSNDRGRTWSSAAPSMLPSSNAPATALRLRSGEIAVAWNNHVHSAYGRQSLVLGLTRDGRTFRGLREIDFTDFADNPSEPAQHVTYPYLAETRQGFLVVSYNKGHWMRHNRPRLARVSSAWLLSRKDVVDFEDGRTGWHTINPGPHKRAVAERYVNNNGTDLWLEIEQSPAKIEATGIARNIPLIADGTARVIVQAIRPEAYLLFGDTLLDPAEISEACLRIRFSQGKIFLAAGVPGRLQKPASRTEYSFLSHSIRDEASYPRPFQSGVPIEVVVRYNATDTKAQVQINAGPTVELRTGRVLGLAYLGLAVAKGGVIRLRSVRTELAG